MPKSTFSSRDRLLKPEEFRQVYSKGRRLVTGYFILFFLKVARGDGRVRLGVTITKGVGNAVQRNRLKRQIREVFRRKKGDLSGGSLVVKAMVGAGKMANQQIVQDLERGLKRL